MFVSVIIYFLSFNQIGSNIRKTGELMKNYRKRMYTSWTKVGPEGADFSESRWREKANFFSWFTKVFVSAVQGFLSSGPVVLFFDGHHSHLSIELLEQAKTWNIHLVCFPAHTSHLLQPMDVGVYGTMKAKGRQILKDHKTSTQAASYIGSFPISGQTQFVQVT